MPLGGTERGGIRYSWLGFFRQRGVLPLPSSGASPRPPKKPKKEETKAHPKPSGADLAYVEIPRTPYQEGDEAELAKKWERYGLKRRQPDDVVKPRTTHSR